MELPRIRTENGPQFISNAFTGFCEEMGIPHERIPIKSPNMIAYYRIISFNLGRRMLHKERI